MAFLDNTGLTYFWSKIKTYLSSNYVDKTTYANTTATLSSHVASTSNPHKVTASQVGAYTKAQTDSAISTAVKEAVSSAYKVKGSVATYADLPTTGQTEGDVYNVVAAYGNYPAGTNWVWVAETTSGSTTTAAHWDALGGAVDLSGYYTNTQVDTKLANKVDKVSGKGLSTNDFTAAYKTKLDGIATGAQVNKLESVKKADGTALVIASDKSVTLPDFALDSDLDDVKAAVSTNMTDITTIKEQIEDIDIPTTLPNPKTLNITYHGTNYGYDGSAQTDITIVDNKTLKFVGQQTAEYDGLTDVTISLPTALKNPTALTFTGGTTGSYDGSVARTVYIPIIDSETSTTSTNGLQNKVITAELNLKAPLASPALTGTPTAPTAASGTSTTQIATTAFVQAAVADVTGAVTAITNAEIDTICAA